MDCSTISFYDRVTQPLLAVNELLLARSMVQWSVRVVLFDALHANACLVPLNSRQPTYGTLPHMGRVPRG